MERTIKSNKFVKIISGVAAIALIVSVSTTLCVNAYSQVGNFQFDGNKSFSYYGFYKKLIWSNDYETPRGQYTNASVSYSDRNVQGDTGQTYVRITCLSSPDKKETKNHYTSDGCKGNHTSSKVTGSKPYPASMNLSATLYTDGEAYQQDNYWTAVWN